MNQSRREFIRGAAAAAAIGTFGGCATGVGRTRSACPREIKGFLAHLGVKMWEERAKLDRFDFDLSVWNALTDRLAERKLNTLVIDLGEGIRYPSHPEIGLPGSWEPERMREEIAKLKRMGILAVPKLNFSSSHNQWLGKWREYLSTEAYYRVVEDVIADVAEIFDESPLFHVGYDEESIRCQGNPIFEIVRLRQGDLWWHDFLHVIGEVEKHGLRAWMWSDYCWQHPDEFFRRMPKSVLQSNWYYGRDLSLEHLRALDAKGPNMGGLREVEVGTFKTLDEAGYDQVPCGSTWSMYGFQTKNFPEIVKHCRKTVAPERLKGFLMAPWLTETKEFNRAKLLESVDNAAAAFALK